MPLKLYIDGDGDAPEEHESQRQHSSEWALPLLGSEYYYVFASYGPEFRHMEDVWQPGWQKTLRGKHRFWPGLAAGGILGVANDIPSRQRYDRVFVQNCFGKAIYGTSLGNEAGQQLSDSLCCATPYRPPAFAVKLGLAEKVPDPTVKATAEHAECLSEERFLLVVPKANRRKPVKLMEQLPEWFATFGVRIGSAPSDVPPPLREEMHDWFGDPDRPMWVLRMEGGVPNAAWQLAVVYYVAEYWDVHARGLDSVHFVANIEERPNFRKNWTSNK